MSGTVDSALQFLPRRCLQELIDALLAEGYDVIGPTVDEEAIVYRPILTVDELPRGWSDRQEPAVYRLEQQDHERSFFFNVGPDSWKRYLFVPRTELSKAKLTDEGWKFEQVREEPPKLAFLGVRACDLAAIAVQDRVFLHGEYVDPSYKRRREAALIVAVNCSTAQPTCFCSSMGNGPECQSGFDLALTELDDGYLMETGSPRGENLVAKVSSRPATASQSADRQREIENAKRQMTKHFDNDGVPDLLMQNLDHPRWQEVSERCLSCTNCTMVCPTCFCSVVEEVHDLQCEQVTRVRSWDSCFNHSISYTADSTVRNNIRSRYRQWLTHKLATWQTQFDVSGCTGCGRCITWCPVGIDLTEEVDAIRDSCQEASP